VGTVEPVLKNRVPGKNRDGKAGMRKIQKGEITPVEALILSH